ncbi:beta-N-acetylhexosaminidase [Paenibacillus filicis]|uniref:beta-N-acetylhexosaminidase n=1 Tax=Paenibacillus filicis TaxID=669464 RepID=A0ABU9DJZ0_9BACL
MSRRLLALVLVGLIAVTAGCSGSTGTASPPKSDALGGGIGDLNPPASPPAAPQPPADPVQSIVEKMTVDEKIGQLVLIGLDGQKLDKQGASFIKDRHIGGVILYKRNIASLSQTFELVRELKTANSGQPLPLWISVDQEGGAVSRLPAEFAALPDNARIGALKNPQLARTIGELLGEELHVLGMNMDFAPVLDVNNNPSNPVIGPRSYGPDAKVVADLGVQAMEGIASRHTVPVVKHFPGHGDTATDSHVELPIVRKSLDELRQLELIPFRQAISGGADAVMVAHLLLPGLDEHNPSSMSPRIVTGLLREELGFQGVVITDDLTMGAIANQRGIGEAAVNAVQAGADIVMIAHGYDLALQAVEALKREVAAGRLTEERLNASVRRIAALKRKYELTDQAPAEPVIEPINKRIRQLKEENPSLKTP